MKNSKQLPLKIFAGVIAVVLIGGILFVTNSFVGNPVSAMLANRAVKHYVVENYPSLDLELGKAIYNFKYGSYMVRARSATSLDTHFTIYYRDGMVTDNYETYVVGKFNTLQRLSEEYSVVAKKILEEELGYDNNRTRVMFDKEQYEGAEDIVEIDMEFDRTLPIAAEVMIDLEVTDNSLEGIAKVLADAHKAFVNNNCNFHKYSLWSYGEHDGTVIMVSGVTSADIEGGQLVALLEKAQTHQDYTGIERGHHKETEDSKEVENRKEISEGITVFVKAGKE